MSKITNYKGFIVKATDGGKVLEIISNDLTNLEQGSSLTSLVDVSSIGKFLSFLLELKNEETALGWEINLKLNSSFISVYLAGFKENDSFTIVGTTDANETRKYYNDLMLMQNQQTNKLRSLEKENEETKIQAEISINSLNELTQINNEMVGLQRELAKKHHKLEALNQELEIKNKELDQFAYIVSHDLKAPLRGISSVINMIEEDYFEEFDEDLKESFKLITGRTKRMDDLINGILSYARAGKANEAVETFKLKDLLADILDGIAAPEGFEFKFPEDLPELTCNYVQLSQVFANYLGNAVKYHDKDEGVIKLEMEKLPNDLLKFSVIDDGPGIPEKYQSKVFEAFNSGNQSSRQDSTGIGLAIVKKLVEKHGGEAGLISEVGKGSTFYFSWPLKIQAE